jgi:serine/threonine protein kinase
MPPRIHGGRQVAIKVLTPEFTRDATRRERLTREARAAAALSHPAIATIFALEEIDGDLYIVSELVRGRTLRQELAGGPVPVERLMPTLIDIASALCAAHQQGIVHRDLKPENIVRREDGQIKILDFGLASVEGANKQTTTRLTQSGIALGTPGYMAPEQVSGGPVDARTDLFAFGVLAWELATGEHPFGADHAALLARMADLMEGRVPGVQAPADRGPRSHRPPMHARLARRALSERGGTAR